MTIKKIHGQILRTALRASERLLFLGGATAGVFASCSTVMLAPWRLPHTSLPDDRSKLIVHFQLNLSKIKNEISVIRVTR